LFTWKNILLNSKAHYRDHKNPATGTSPEPAESRSFPHYCHFLKIHEDPFYYYPPHKFRNEPGTSVSIESGYEMDYRAIEVRSPAEAKGFFP
jgi:hypothetical protein